MGDDWDDLPVVIGTATERRTERLLNIVQVLLASPGGVSRQELMAVFDSASQEAFERSFERDKDELRSMGIPIEVVTDGNVIAGYRLERGATLLPELVVTPEQAAVLSLAARAWDNAALGQSARNALVKLEARGVVFSDPSTIVEPYVATIEAAFGPLFRAVTERRVATFAYRASGAALATPRRVRPWGLVARLGRWYLVAFDEARKDVRVFRLSRIEGKVSATSAAASYEIPADADVRGVVERYTTPVTDQEADLLLRPDTAYSVHRRASSTKGRTVGPAGDERDHITVAFGDVDLFAAEICSHGGDVVVAGPEELRDIVVRRLRLTVAAHGVATDGDGRSA